MPGPLPLKDTTVEPLQKGHLGDRRKWRLSPGRGVIWPTFFREYNMFIVQNSYWLYPKTVIQSYIITSKKYVIQKSYEAVPTGSAVRKEENEKKGKIRFKEKKNRKKCTKKTKIVMPRFELTPLNDVLKQNVKVTKPSRFATYYSPYKYRRQFVLTAVAKMKHNRKAILPRLIINAPLTRIKFYDHSWLYISRWKN